MGDDAGWAVLLLALLPFLPAIGTAGAAAAAAGGVAVGLKRTEELATRTARGYSDFLTGQPAPVLYEDARQVRATMADPWWGNLPGVAPLSWLARNLPAWPELELQANPEPRVAPSYQPHAQSQYNPFRTQSGGYL